MGGAALMEFRSHTSQQRARMLKFYPLLTQCWAENCNVWTDDRLGLCEQHRGELAAR